MCIMSPWLFNVYINGVMKEEKMDDERLAERTYSIEVDGVKRRDRSKRRFLEVVENWLNRRT